MTFHSLDCTCESDPLGRCIVHRPIKVPAAEAQVGRDKSMDDGCSAGAETLNNASCEPPGPLAGVSVDRCSSCKQLIDAEPNWSDEDAEAEWLRNFADDPSEPRCVVCRDCYVKIMAFNNHEII